MKKIFIKIIFILVVIMFNIVMFFNIEVDKNIIKIFKTSFLVVSSGSMIPELAVGDVVVIRESEDYEINDIITYNVNNEYLVTHRIVEKRENGFVTKGDNNNVNDLDIVILENIEGKLIHNSKILKFIYKYWLILIIIIFIILITM